MEEPSDISNPNYKGVRKRKRSRWVSEIRLPNSRDRIWLGSYDSPVKAARAFDAALYCLRGPDAKFNFPDSPPVIPGGRSLTPKEIQVVASRFANEEPAAVTVQAPQRNDDDDHHQLSRVDNIVEHYATSFSDGLVVQQLDSGLTSTTNIDWSFLNQLDHSSIEGTSDFGFFSGLDNNNAPTDYHELYQSSVLDYYDDGEGDFSHKSFLWNF